MSNLFPLAFIAYISCYVHISTSFHCWYSEYIIGTKPLKQNFPQRNRIIAALCDALLVIEANKRSGTMITVNCALEQGREIYAVPGNITSINSAGTNELIKQGAKILTTVKDIN